MKYKSIVATRLGGPENLQVIEKDLRSPREGEARIKVLAVPVCVPDITSRYGHSPFPPKMPLTPGYAVIGLVDALGQAVRHRAVLLYQTAFPGRLGRAV